MAQSGGSLVQYPEPPGVARASFTSPRQVRQAIDRFIQVYNTQATPFEWTKTTVKNTGLVSNYSNLRN